MNLYEEKITTIFKEEIKPKRFRFVSIKILYMKLLLNSFTSKTKDNIENKNLHVSATRAIQTHCLTETTTTMCGVHDALIYTLFVFVFDV